MKQRGSSRPFCRTQQRSVARSSPPVVPTSNRPRGVAGTRVRFRFQRQRVRFRFQEAEGALPIPEEKGALPVPEAEGEQCQNAAPNPPAEFAAPADEIDASIAPESTESCVIDADAVSEEGVEKDPLWDYVTPCTTRDAAKAVDLRAVLEARCGKDGAKSLLAHTKATVAQDASGKKNRVLKLDGSFIKLKSEV